MPFLRGHEQKKTTFLLLRFLLRFSLKEFWKWILTLPLGRVHKAHQCWGLNLGPMRNPRQTSWPKKSRGFCKPKENSPVDTVVSFIQLKYIRSHFHNCFGFRKTCSWNGLRQMSSLRTWKKIRCYMNPTPRPYFHCRPVSTLSILLTSFALCETGVSCADCQSTWRNY